MRYTPEDYEYAIRILYHRHELVEQEVEEWMRLSEHLELLQELAAVRMQGEDIPIGEYRQEKKKLVRKLNQNRRLWAIGSVAASILIALGCWQILNLSKKIIEPVSQLTTITPGKSKALLILADGKEVDLQTFVKEIPYSTTGIIKNDSLEGLKYTGLPVTTEEYNLLRVPVGGFYKLELADGSKVWLNAQSELRYPVTFVGEQREVWLKGEGYFEVTHDEKKQFCVHLDHAVVTVLGTTFNVSAYADESDIYTTLVSGAVCFQSDINEQSVTLQPGKQSIMNCTTGKIDVKEVDTQIYTSWREGRFVFRFMNLELIMRQLQRWYDFDISWINPEVKEYEFRGVIQRDSRIEDVFRAIELATDVKCKIVGKQVTIEKR